MEKWLYAYPRVLDNEYMKNILSAGAVLDGLAVAATQYFGLAGEFNYLWAVLAVMWGFLIWQQK